mmetsp:Transcript_10184/g.22590  ORF Transcript_10184/g.22590 Transcript_10184/m.22590 type:complete len:210 (-) Transcript_10184:266-895(-)|eukprot:CAMPEP_0113300450 /NCGR_PEP_ID=MMETSP0010_2-20120614/2076_1 /TAXON_ID=216773 ORGANISM="Corethron hystrix, Strain 308" /NCGR_SAMPLE_ID=MMETSP0010_2 /ASSEMBLY_ACC=CAM_ASM_000155 /LENGTH=209 /DNA_ID=CAMNT_0000153879 /DNA_START=227 /DNA_END=856 /DNA_ORIENTATION=+ /assembly_acc=CAM_ASM_000155
MKFSTVSAIFLVSGIAAFSPSATFTRDGKTTLSMTNNNMERSDFFKSVAGSVAFAALGPAQPAMAAKYGGIGRGSTNMASPSDAIIDNDIMSSDAVQKSLKDIKSYYEVVTAIKGEIQKNPQADIAPYLRKNFDFALLRSSLNTFNTAFDEDTQRGTDKIIRIIIQDVDELEVNSRLKEGIPRSEKRLVIITAKLNKLEKAFGDFIAFS